MTRTMSPRAVAATILSLIDAGRWNDLAAYYGDDAVVDQPFALPEPVRIDGRAAIAAHFAVAAKMPLAMRVRDARFTEGADGETVVAEYRYDLIDPGGNRLAQVANVQLFRIVDGKVAASRDYHDHHRIGAAFAALRAQAG
ncbi:MAG: nuclear transport factor 2 family protein [Pseudomonadota bacterium]|nr:nuclear transport factor 2 family protein [Pseudomonadota bacterium]